MINSITYYKLIDELVYNLVIETTSFPPEWIMAALIVERSKCSS